MSKETELLFSANRLSLLSRMDRRAVEKRLLHVTPAKVSGKNRLYRLADALPLLCQAEENAALENRILSDRARQASADADIRELERAEKVKTLVFRKHAVHFMKDVGIRMRQRFVTVLKRNFTEKQRAELCKVFNDTLNEIPNREPILDGEEPGN